MSLKSIAYTIVMVVGLSVVGTVGAAIYAWDYFSAPGPVAAPTTVVIAPKTGVTGIAQQLADAHVIDQPLVFKALAVGLGTARNFKAGEYLFDKGMSPRDVMQLMAEGKVVVHKITVPEGWKVREVVALLQNEPLLLGDVPRDIPEGSLMPQTYHFERGDTRASVVKRMQEQMSKLLAELWAKHAPGIQVQTPQEAMTLASIVEKETGVKDERGHVASVFMNRLRMGMRLQSDPTVVYGMEQAMGAALGRPLTSEDLRTPTPYNTYVITGLPPGPIANPGQASLEAVMNPPDTKDLYFVATGKGGHHFAASLDEHNRNVQTYRQAMRAQ